MYLRSYFRLISYNWELVCFGFVMAFSSSFGQTFFIGVFGPEIQSEFGLSHTLWSSIYMIGTLASAVLLPWTGSLIDRFDLTLYTLLVGLFLITACIFITSVTGMWSLIIAIFLLRQFGQGLTSHVSVTSMVRYFDSERGHAIALATMGMATGKALLPFCAIITITIFGWRWTYLGAAGLLGVVLIPLSLWLLKGHNHRHQMYLTGLKKRENDNSPGTRSWNRVEVLHERRFYLLLPGLLAPSVVLTAMFFHHLNLADAKGWSHTWVTGNYVLFAVSTAFTVMVSGHLVDRFRAVNLLPYMLIPLVFGLALVSIIDTPWVVLPYMLLIGINLGMVYTVTSSVWPELYGVKYIGAIKSMAASISVLGSALGPVIVGGLMDLGMSIESVCLLFSAYSILAGGLILIALRLNLANETCLNVSDSE